MSRLKNAGLLSLWLIVGTTLYAGVWSRHLDYFPQLPSQVGVWISALVGLNDSDDAESLTFWYVLIVSFTTVGSATLLGWGALHAVRRRRT